MSNISKLAWNKVDWKKVESRVFRIQRRIYKAKIEKKVNVVHYLQKKIINSIDGKLIGIREAIKIQKTCWIKILYLNNKKKNITTIYTLKVKKKESRNNTQNSVDKSNQNKPINILVEKSHLIKKEATQSLIQLALEPEWCSIFEINSMGHQLGQSYQDTIENVNSKQEAHVKWVYHKKLFDNSQTFNKKRFLKKLNTIKPIEAHIEKWLNIDFMLHFEKQKTHLYNEFNFEKRYKNIIVPLLCDIGLNGLETYLQDFKNNLKNLGAGNKIQYFRYLDEILIVAEDTTSLNQTIMLFKTYLNVIGLKFGNKNWYVSKTTEGINFLGFQLRIARKKNNFYKKISISKESKKLLLSKTRFIIQKNKSVSSYYLIKRLTRIILTWGIYFQYCDCKSDFLQMDNKILNQLKVWAFRRKAQGKNRSFVKETYFPSEISINYQGNNYKNNWVLTGQIKNSNKILTTFLPKLYWIKEKKYRSVKNIYSIYNGDYSYWFKRLSNLESEQKTLLQRQFLVEGKIEIYNLFTTKKKNS